MDQNKAQNRLEMVHSTRLAYERAKRTRRRIRGVFLPIHHFSSRYPSVLPAASNRLKNPTFFKRLRR